jgi:hypothetical protein
MSKPSKLPAHVRQKLRRASTSTARSNFTTGGLPKKKAPPPITLRLPPEKR